MNNRTKLILTFIVTIIVLAAFIRADGMTQPTLSLVDDKQPSRTFTMDGAGNFHVKNGVGGFEGSGNIKALRGDCSLDVDTVIQPDAVSFYRLVVHGDACKGIGTVVVTRTVQGVQLTPLVLVDTHSETKAK